jgi:hypothetical protein
MCNHISPHPSLGHPQISPAEQNSSAESWLALAFSSDYPRQLDCWQKPSAMVSSCGVASQQIRKSLVFRMDRLPKLDEGEKCDLNCPFGGSCVSVNNPKSRGSEAHRMAYQIIGN